MNRATRINVALLGAIFGISGMNHGLFETLQGNTPTGGMFISAIDEAHQMWPHGAEPAFTLIPNFLLTGFGAMFVGLAIIIWSCGFVHKKNGTLVLLLLFILLLLVGGGVAQVLFFPWICLVAWQINSPLTFWERRFNGRLSLPVKFWPWTLAVSFLLLVAALQIAVTGYFPGVSDPDAVVMIMLGFLAAEVFFLPLTFITGYARDIAVKSRP
jgi:hypothetical protein